MNKTPIEWADFSVNPLRFRNLATGKVGHHCDKISPGCKYCYSSTMQAGPYLSGLTFIEQNKPKGEFFLDENTLQQVLKRRKPCRIFWADMTDLFLADYPDEWIDRCFAVMALTPQHTHMVLTKRAVRMREYFSPERQGALTHTVVAVAYGNSTWIPAGAPPIYPYGGALARWPLRNVWLGTSVEDQQRKDRIELLRQTPAAVRFLSLEPLLEDLGELDLRGIDLAIIGGESGSKARPMDLAWARNIVQQCKETGTKCFVKQLGAKPMSEIESGFVYAGARVEKPQYRLMLDDKKGGDISEWPSDLQVREMPAVASC